MTSPGQKTKKKKKRRTAKGSKEYFVRKKTGKRHCALCAGLLHGVPHGKKVSEVRKMSKTEKRPSAQFGGVLCGKCRKTVKIEKVKVENGLKDVNYVDLRVKKLLSIKEIGK